MHTLESNLIKNMFDKIAVKYDFINNLISFGTHNIVKKLALKQLHIKPNSKVLDLCCGSGDLGRIVKNLEPTCDVIGVDCSSNMLDIARKRNPNITYWEMDAISLSFDKNSFDYVIMGFGLRNIARKNQALEEIRRVLKTNGVFLHLDFGKTNFISKIYDNIILFISKFFIKDMKPLKYLVMSKDRFLSPDELLDLFKFNKLICVKKNNLCFNIISYQIMKKEN